MKAREIRRSFLSYYEGKDHVVVPSAPLVPANDPTLLFANSGMVPFKDVLLGRETRSYKRAASIQKCLRVSGKHNDIDEVGRTARHHTFFEMLGAFSFGDYFKGEAIRFAYEVATKLWGMDPKRLVFTVFGGEGSLAPDEEARALWKKVAGVGDDRILGLGRKDNFWQMGPIGPCGTNSEINFYQGDHFPCAEEQHGRSCKGPACDCDRWLEFWNTVFMQYELHEDGRLTPLPAPSIDVGVGFERVSAILNGQSSNYHTDLFLPLLDAIGDLAGKRYSTAAADWTADDSISMRVIADHARSTAFCMADGIFPSNTRREYVLRRLMRRAISHGELLGIKDVFLHKIVDKVIDEMGDDYPELRERRETILSQTRREEEGFRATVENSLARLGKMEEDLNNPAIWRADGSGTRVLRGEAVFHLKDTHGCPIELMSAVGKRRGWEIDEAGYEALLDEQQKRSRKSQKLGEREIEGVYKALVEEVGPTQFLGYEGPNAAAPIAAIFVRQREGEAVSRERAMEARAGAEIEIIANKTPFYGEAGGQVGDKGTIKTGGGSVEVTDTVKPVGDLIVHVGVVREGAIQVGEDASFEVDVERRRRIRSAHSATHLLHYALRKVLGLHVAQKGSKVEPDRLRFDFSHHGAPTQEELRTVEDLVNQMIRDNVRANTQILPIAEAKQQGAIAFFGEKYGQEVRTVRIHDSFELCGGTHVNATGDIGLVKITSSTPLGAGIRRLEALTGHAALAYFWSEEHVLQRSAALLKASPAELPEKIEKLLHELTQREQQLADLRSKLASGQAEDIFRGVKTIDGGVKVLATRAPFVDAKDLRELGDSVKDRLTSGIILLGGTDGDKVTLICIVTPDLTSRFKAGELIRIPAEVVGGRGGGKPELAQAGGKDPSKLDEALAKFIEAVGARA